MTDKNMHAKKIEGGFEILRLGHFWAYMTQWMTAGFIKSICTLFGFAVVLHVFAIPMKSEWLIFFTNCFQECSKNL